MMKKCSGQKRNQKKKNERNWCHCGALPLPKLNFPFQEMAPYRNAGKNRNEPVHSQRSPRQNSGRAEIIKKPALDGAGC